MKLATLRARATVVTIAEARIRRTLTTTATWRVMPGYVVTLYALAPGGRYVRHHRGATSYAQATALATRELQTGRYAHAWITERSVAAARRGG